MPSFPPGEFRKHFRECWERLHREFFKVEALQFYDESDCESFRLWFAGERELAKPLIAQEVIEALREEWQLAKEKGVAFRRLHVVELPLSEYLEYELESYKVSRAQGEEILLASRTYLGRLPYPLVDFMLFDDRVMILHFDATGVFRSFEIQEGEDAVRPYRELQACLLAHARPLEEFLQEHKR